MAGGRELSDNSDLSDDIGFQLRLAYAAVMQRFAEALRPFDLRPSLYAALVIIEANPGRKQHEVGEALGVATSNLGVLMRTLSERGLVVRERVPGNIRSYALRLTAAGAALLQEARAAQAKAVNDIDHLIGERRALFASVLADLAKMAPGP